MVDFRPFPGIRYCTNIAGPLEALVCPPYDVIGPQEEQSLQARSPYNFVRLELADPRGTPHPERYAQAASVYRRWLAEGVLVREQAPAYYLLRQRFHQQGTVLERHAIIGALKLEELGTGVLPHEETAPGPKADRLALMRATAANFSPLMGLFRDADREVEAVRVEVAAGPPAASAAMSEVEQLELWMVSDPQLAATIGRALKRETIYVADGHHRYETALAYKAEKSGPRADSVMMSVISFHDPGLRILPYHRLVHGLSPQLLQAVLDRMAQLCLSQPAAIPMETSQALENLMACGTAPGPVFGLVGPNGEGPHVMRVANWTLVEPHLARAPSGLLANLEAWLLQEVLLRPVLGDNFPRHVTATHDGEQALREVRSGEKQLAFFLRGVSTALFADLVRAGVRMPRKSTYFHPKLPSGLVVHTLD